MKKLLTLLLLTLSGAALCADPAVDPREPDQIILETPETLRETVNERRAEFENNPELLKQLVNRDMLPLIDTGYSAEKQASQRPCLSCSETRRSPSMEM